MSLVSATPPGLHVGHVRGVTLAKWRRVWDERYRAPLSVVEVEDAAQLHGVRAGTLDLCFVRLPIDRDGLHCIPLYDEQMVAWVSKDHAVAAVDEVTMDDLADETVLTAFDAVALDRVLAGAVLVVPMSIARGASRRDLTYRPITDASPCSVGLVWRVDADNPLIDEFIGVVRGRTARSSRSNPELAAGRPSKGGAEAQERRSPARGQRRGRGRRPARRPGRGR